MNQFTEINIIDPMGNPSKSIQMTDESGLIWCIPADPANSDYQRYLNPEAEQSTPNLS